MFSLTPYLLILERYFSSNYRHSNSTNRDPLVIGLFLYSYVLKILQKVLKVMKVKEAKSFHFKYRPDFSPLIILNLKNVYPLKLETTDIASSASS